MASCCWAWVSCVWSWSTFWASWLHAAVDAPDPAQSWFCLAWSELRAGLVGVDVRLVGRRSSGCRRRTASDSACSSADRVCWSCVTACWSWSTSWALAPDGAAMVYEPSKPMEPPSCTELVRVVRTTAAVATGPSPLVDEAPSLLPLVDAMATPAATAPPTRAPAMAAMATTRLAGHVSHWRSPLRDSLPARRCRRACPRTRPGQD